MRANERRGQGGMSRAQAPWTQQAPWAQALRAVLAGLAALPLLAACGGKSAEVQPPPPKPYEIPQKAASPQAVQWGYAPGGLTLDLRAVPELNAYEGLPHSLALCIYQLKEPTAFNHLSETTGGSRRLFACDRFDASVVDVKRRFVGPGDRAKLVLDRAEGARFVAVAAGYYDFQPGFATRVWQIPLSVGQEGHLFWKSNVYGPGSLDMELLLGPNSILRRGGD